MVVLRAELVYIAADDIQLRAHKSERTAKLVKGNTACLGSSRTRKDRRVEHIKVNCEIDVSDSELFNSLFTIVEIELIHERMLTSERKLITVAASDSELKNTSVAEDIVTSSEHAGMGELLSEIILTQVCMSVKVNDV